MNRQEKEKSIKVRMALEWIRTLCGVAIVCFIAFAVAYAFLGGF